MGGILDTSETVLKGRIKNNYEIVDKMEDNSLSLLFKCKDKKTNNLVAIRVYMKQYLERIYGPDKLEFARKNLRKEIEYLKTCEGDYSLHLIDDLENQDGFNIVTELWDTTLERHVINLGGSLTIKEIKDIFNKLNIGLREMYKNDIIHGDLSLRNILVKYKEDDFIIPKISNYGKKILFDEKLGLMYSETYYAAPELLSGEKYNNKIDLWSIGIILYRLFFGEFPYKGKTQVAIYDQIMKQKPLKKRGGKDDLFDDLISKLLQINPRQRIDWEDYFSHEFWTNRDLEEDSDSEESDMFEDYRNDRNDIGNINTNINANIYTTKRSLRRSNITNNNNAINNINNNINAINNNINIIKNDEKEEDEDDLKDEKDLNIKKRFIIFYSLSSAENSCEANRFSITLNVEEFHIAGRNKLKKMEVFLNEQDIDEYSNNNINLTQDNKEAISSSNPLLSELLLKKLIKKVPHKNIYKLILFSCKLKEIEALNCPSFENLTELDLSNNNLDNLEIFTKNTFKNLISLNLKNNKITNLEPLKRVLFKSLSNLNISNNNISNIDVFAKVPFKSLDKLNLSSNSITDLEIFKNVPFKNLSNLNISDNQITDPKSALDKLNLPNLNVFDLSHNDISDISGLSSNIYQKLKLLNLGKNQIKNIDILNRVHFLDLNILLLYDNKIKDINVLGKAPFVNLICLNLSYNEISDINILNNIPFTNLERLDLSGNTICNIDPLSKMPMNNLRELYLKNNRIEKNVFNNNVFEEIRKKYKNILID